MYETIEMPKQQLACMEIWGGNDQLHSNVELHGISAWVYSQPHGQSLQGGDIHYMTSCATGRITRVFIADVSGHGEMVSSSAVYLKRIMRRHINRICQKNLLTDINKNFSQYFEQQEQEISAPGQFATAVTMTYFAPTGKLVYSVAGHPIPLIFRATEGRWYSLHNDISKQNKISGIPLGISAETIYEQQEVTLADGDIVLLYTDALLEEIEKNAKDHGIKTIIDLLNKAGHGDYNQIIPTLLRDIKIDEVPDDFTLLTFTPKQTSSPTLLQKIVLPWLMTKAMIKSIVDRNSPMPWPELSLKNLGGAFINFFNKSK